MKKILLILMLICSTNMSAADLTISGLNFGSPAIVYSWDTFESHTKDIDIDGLTPDYGFEWSALDVTKSPTISDTQAFGGSQSVLVDWEDVDYTISAFGWSGEGPIGEFYMSYWRYQDTLPNTIAPSNAKQLYTFNLPGGTSSGVEFLPFCIQQASSSRFKGTIQGPGMGDNPFTCCGGLTGGWVWSYGEAMTPYIELNELWKRYEFWVDWDTPYNAQNGSFEVWFDNLPLFAAPDNGYMDMIDDNNPEGQMDDIFLGYMFQTGGVEYTRRQAFYDNVYIASSRARVEIGDAPSYASCTLKNIQFSSVWNDSLIYIPTVNSAGFDSGDYVYVYVIDEDGTASNSISYEIGSVVDEIPMISNAQIRPTLISEGGNAIFSYDVTNTEADYIKIVFGDGDKRTMAYQDTIHHTFDLDIESDSTYDVKFIVWNIAGADTLIIYNGITILESATELPYE
jgi:hypothetical protein